MKYVKWIAGVLVGLVVALGVLQYVASERVEVVELHTQDANGEVVTTRLWVVDDEGFTYLRASGESSGWYGRIKANESLELTRDGVTNRYQAVERPDKNRRINELMQEKYTWGESLISMLVPDRENAIPIELRPVG